jgi:hypothetical protein
LKKWVTRKWRRKPAPRPSVIRAMEIPEVFEETIIPGFQYCSIFA